MVTLFEGGRDRQSKINHEKRTTIRSLSQQLGVSRGTTFNLIKQEVIKKKNSHLKPSLTDKQKKERLNFFLQQIDLPNQCFSFFNNLIHIDEKWFFMKKDHLSIYSLPDEPEINRKEINKLYIEKVMFLVAVCLPRYGHKRNKQFNGNLGFWDLTEEVPEQRTTKNRPKGTLLLRPIISVNKKFLKQLIINNLLPAISENFPRDSDEIVIQMDNCSSHIDKNDLDFRRAVSNYNLNIIIKKQPPKSPDLNVLDLGYFTSIQSLHQKEKIGG